MSPIDRFAESCIARAARRWPEDLSETMSREWRAELAALRADPALGSFVHGRRAIAFAVSLACSPAVEAEDAVALRWRDRTAGLGRAMTALAGAVGVTLLAAALFNLVHHVYHNLYRHVSVPVGIAADVGLLAAAVAAMSWVGVVTARRSPLLPSSRFATTAALYAVPLGLAMYAFLLAGNQIAVMPFMGWTDIAPGVAAWTALTGISLGFATWFAASGRRRLGWSIGTVGSVVALESAAFCGSLHAADTLKVGFDSAPAWFPLALLPGGTVSFGHLLADGTASFGGRSQSGPAFHASDILLGNLSAMVGPLLLCSGFAVAYAMCRVRDTAPASVVVATDHAPVLSPRRFRAVAASTGVAGLAIWVYLAALAHNPDANSGDAVRLRTTAIMLMVSGLVVVLAGRGPVTAPAVGTFAVLFAADKVADHAPRYGLAPAITLVAVCGGTIYGAWLLSGELAGRGTTDKAARRALVAIAVVSALMTPTSQGIGAPTTGDIAAVSYALGTLPWLLAVTAALASRRLPLGRPVTVAVTGLPLVLLLSVSGTAAQVYVSFPIRALLAVVALAAASWTVSVRRMRQTATWLALGIVATILSLPMSTALRQSDDPVSTTLTRIEHNSNIFGFGFASNVVGQILLAAVLGVLAARWAVASEAAAPARPVANRPAPAMVAA